LIRETKNMVMTMFVGSTFGIATGEIAAYRRLVRANDSGYVSVCLASLAHQGSVKMNYRTGLTRQKPLIRTGARSLLAVIWSVCLVLSFLPCNLGLNC
jgi:hypothetical protein